MADLTTNPLDGFVITRNDIDFIGTDLQRPECILAEPDGGAVYGKIALHIA